VSAGTAVADAVGLFVPEVLDVVLLRVVADFELEELCVEEDAEVVTVAEEVELVDREATVAVLLNPETPIIVCAVPAGMSNVPSPV